MGFGDRRFFVSLFPEDGPEICKHEGCNRKRIYNSVMCAVHHYEMIKRKPCPWNETYSDLSAKEQAFVQRETAKANLEGKTAHPQCHKKTTRGKPIDKECPKCNSKMSSINKVNWPTIAFIILLPPIGFFIFLLSGIIEKKAVCNNCFHEELLHRVF